MDNLPQSPYIITDPEILDFIVHANNNDINPITVFRKAIRERIVPEGTHVTEQSANESSSTENGVIISKTELKKLYSEWLQIQNIHGQVIKSLQKFKPRHFIKFCEAHTDIVSECLPCPQHCGYIAASKIGLGLHLRKCLGTETSNTVEVPANIVHGLVGNEDDEAMEDDDVKIAK